MSDTRQDASPLLLLLLLLVPALVAGIMLWGLQGLRSDLDRIQARAREEER